jgi:hypothetical protein
MPETIAPGHYPDALIHACRLADEDPATLFDWAVKREEVILILESGRKVRYEVQGKYEMPVVMEYGLETMPVSEPGLEGLKDSHDACEYTRGEVAKERRKKRKVTGMEGMG